jgi:hypothetical protein
MVTGVRKVAAIIKRIAVDLAKSVCQVAERAHVDQVSQRNRLSRDAFRQRIQEQVAPVEWVMEACGTTHWGRFVQIAAYHHRQLLAETFHSDLCWIWSSLEQMLVY